MFRRQTSLVQDRDLVALLQSLRCDDGKDSEDLVEFVELLLFNGLRHMFQTFLMGSDPETLRQVYDH